MENFLIAFLSVIVVALAATIIVLLKKKGNQIKNEIIRAEVKSFVTSDEFVDEEIRAELITMIMSRIVSVNLEPRCNLPSSRWSGGDFFAPCVSEKILPTTLTTRHKV